MSKILNQYPVDMDKRTAYRLTKANTVKKVSEIAGSVINPSAWILYEDQDEKTGELKTVLTIEDNGELFGTISKTFIKAFIDAADFFGDELGSVKVISGKSKAGREYVTCEIV